MTQKRKITYRPAVSRYYCDQMASKYDWEQPRDPKLRYQDNETDPILRVNCGFYGDAEFPKNRMDLTQGDVNE
ncbi:hypothetical protein [Adonisia turfae]|uniref:Uncharacterized protein n=1 Tax=Adonisia turfae CCMR0081 TaxID=2292702 RepID=A0A6M0RP30_9CYAN|nr:hypothetical protein [Adonisia turfae]NEZ57513.1 hypothetical protein [Adonisia turfae CCMR0081]